MSRKNMGMYGGFNQDEYVVYIGRLATGTGLIGLFVGLITSQLLHFGTIGTVLLTAFLCYVFTAGYWGGYKLNRWYRKYRYRIPSVIFQVSRALMVAVGVVLGVVGLGFFEHFILLLAMGGGGKPGMIASQLILLPYFGPWYADKISYHPSQVEY